MRKPGVSASFFALSIGILACGARLPAQTPPTPTVEKEEGCPLSPGEYQSLGYTLREVNVDNVFNRFFLLGKPLALPSGVAFPVAGAAFRVKDAVDAAAALTDQLHNRAPENPSPFNVTAVVDYISNCTDLGGKKQLDLTYKAFTTRIPIASGLTLESRTKQSDDPAQEAGAVKESSKATLRPTATYSLSDRLRMGGAVSMRAAPGGIFETMEVSGQGSATSHVFRAAFAGNAAPAMKLVDRAEWRLTFADDVLPTEENQFLAQRMIGGQASAQSRPFGKVGAVLRYGLSFEGGDQNSNLAGSADGRFLSSTSYGAFRIYTGVGFSTDNHSFAGSYGLLLGGLPGGDAVDYRKHILDFAWDSRYRVADHTILQLETRLTGGWLQTPRAAPVAERFFGGNVEHFFIEGDDWRIRSNPVIRSIPENRLNRSGTDSIQGGENFGALNLTASVPVWKYPLVPTWLSRSPTFKDAVDLAKGTARSQAVVYYRSKDPAQQSMAADGAAVGASLETLFKHLSEIQSAVPGTLADDFANCLDEVDLSRDRLAKLKETGFGPISTVIVPKVKSACEDPVAPKLNDAVLNAELKRLTALADSVTAKVKQVRDDVAQQKADEDLNFAFRAIDTFVNQVNALSIGPAVLFDLARIGPQVNSAGGGLRKALGLGARLTVMNVLNLTGGYAWTLSPQPWEKSGAIFFSLTISDLLR